MKSITPWKRLLTIPIVTALFALATLFAFAGAAVAASAPPIGTCPNSNALRNFQAADNVAAFFSNTSSTTTYTFVSLTNESPVNGVPGLIKYCVYPIPATQPTSVDPQAQGENGAFWVSGKDSKDFMFVRPAGDPSNIPLDGKTTTTKMGTATWSSVPTDQFILLHINDPGVCTDLYGAGSPGTCFVIPSNEGEENLSCNAGDGATDAAYNAFPFGVVNCSPPSEAFEAQSASEFGDEVGLAGTARKLVSLNVVFSSYACSDSGDWHTGDCATTAGTTFTHPITANIYSVKTTACPAGLASCPDVLLKSVTVTQTIPFRPSADPVNCTVADGNDPAQWFNPLANGGAGGCQYSIQKVLTFTFLAGTTLPNNVIWTVAFNTSDYGDTPLRPQLCNATSAGCPYDSLNVATKTYPGAPYAGTDVDLNGAFLDSTWTGAYCDGGTGGTGTLRLDTGTVCWSPFKPLGEIITAP